ncbi:MAG: lysophospholipid acyltransferase family protein [Spirochaetes bacterium]|nr:lysophospholipid acyltransferase family protein [Spirochaetota bacterium]
MKKALLRFLKITIAPFLFFCVTKFIYATLKLEIIGAEQIASGNAVIGIWHSDFVVFSGFCSRHHRNIVIMTSYSDDGEVLSRNIKLLGGDVVRGDERRHGARALIGILNAYRNGNHIVFALDGPLGPRRKAKPGAVFASRKLERPLQPVICTAEKAWRFKSWDRLFIPKPFSRARLVFGGPLIFPAGESEDVSLQKIEHAMQALYDRYEYTNHS